MKHTVVGIDIAKSGFQLHWVEPETGEVMNKQVKRANLLEHFANRTPCLIGMEACGGSQHWSRRAASIVNSSVYCRFGTDFSSIDSYKQRIIKFPAVREIGARSISIPKKNGRLRLLGIPCMVDRAQQALYLLALAPISETMADPHSYGYRQERSAADAVAQCFNVLAHQYAPEWILEGDIEGCFDNISHQWLVANVPMDKVILQKWLKAGYIENRQLFPTEAGTPQGAIISPALSNWALDGLQKDWKRSVVRNAKWLAAACAPR